MSNQINAQEIVKKEFLNIFELSYLFNVSGITARRYIKNIIDKIDLLQDRLKLGNQSDAPPILQELNGLKTKARKRVVGQTQAGESMYILELANKEAFINWELRPNIRDEISGVENLITQEGGRETDVGSQASDKSDEQPARPVVTDIFAPKYIQLLETQVSEKDATIKDLRETNKFLSITNGKLNEQLRLLLEKPQEPQGA